MCKKLFCCGVLAKACYKNLMDKKTLRLWRKKAVSFGQRFVSRKLAAPVSIVGLAAAIFYVMILTAPELEPTEVVENSWPVSTVSVRYEDLAPVIRVYGEVVARRTVDVQPMVGGQIVEVWESFKEGGLVEAGEPLVRIDPFEYEASVQEAKASLQEGRARLTESESRYAQEREMLASDEEKLTLRARDLARSDRLAEQGYVSERTLDDRKFSVNQAEQSVRSRRYGLEINKVRLEQQRANNERLESALSRAYRDLKNTLVVAPFRGLLERVSLGVGQNVGPGASLAKLIDVDSLEVRFNLVGNQLGYLVDAHDGRIKGREVEVLWRLGDAPLQFKAYIDRIGARMNNDVGGVNVYAIIDVPKGEVFLRSGAFVEVTFRSEVLPRVMTLPEDAVFENETVYVVGADSRLEARNVVVVGRERDKVFVRGDLKSEERVLTTRFPEAGEGVLVRVL